MKQFLLLLIVVSGVLVGPAQAEDYPSRPITMIVPYPAGGPSDVVARIMAEGMSRHLGQGVVVENVGGAGGTLGTTRVAEARADGYTILAASMGSHVAAPALYANLKYDSTRDFAPIGLVSNAPAAVVARADFPAGDLKEFIARLRNDGDNIKQAHGGVGSSSHMACLLFTSQLKLKPRLVPYRGTAPALNDLLGGHVDFFCEQVVSVAPAVRAGKIKAYAVSDSARSPALPGVPSAEEAGDPQYRFSIWSAIFAPKGTPPEAIDRLVKALDQTLDEPGVQQHLADLGGTVPARPQRGPAALETALKSDLARWVPILKEVATATKSE